MCALTIILWDISKYKMPDIKGINTDSASLGGDLPDTYLNRDMPWRKQERKMPPAFRKGEIIHGEIIEIISPREAFVRLPSGVMRAWVAGNLKKGDSLFFQVQETEPYLILKIFSSSLKKDGEDIHEDEIVRILDIPDNEFFKSIIAFYREKKSVITREDIFRIEKASSRISAGYLDDITMNELFNIVYIMEENKIQQTSANFLKLKPVHKSPGSIHEKMLELDRQIDKYPDLRTLYQQFFDSIRLNGKSAAEALILMNGHGKNESRLADVLKNINRLESESKSDELLKELLSFFSSLTESAEFLRKTSEIQYNSYFIFIPVNISMFFAIARFTVRNIRKGEQNPVKAGITIMDIMNSIIQTDSFMEDKKALRHGLFSQSEKACRLLCDTLNRYIASLHGMGIETLSVLISNFPDDDFEVALKSNAGQMKNFSIVV